MLDWETKVGEAVSIITAFIYRGNNGRYIYGTFYWLSLIVDSCLCFIVNH